MIHRLFTVASAVSLMLCVATLLLCGRSFRVVDSLVFQTTHYRSMGGVSGVTPSRYRCRARSYTLRMNRGRIDLHVERSLDLPLASDDLREWKEVWPEDTRILWERDDAHAPWGNGARVMRVFWGDEPYEYYVGPMRFGMFNIRNQNAVVDGLGRVTRLIRATRRRLSRLCDACGYDLRATPDRCPECGTPARDEGATV